MTDLIYGGRKWREELLGLFPTAKIEDASDEIHPDRLSIDVDIDPWEYRRIAMLNGYYKLSLCLQLTEPTELLPKVKEWRREYPEYFTEDKP